MKGLTILGRQMAGMLAATLLVALSPGQSPTATATITHHSEPVRGFRQGDDFLLPLTNAQALGWTVTRRNETVRLIAESQAIDLPIRRYGQIECLSLKGFARESGAITNWLPGYDAFEMMAPISRIVAKRGALSIEGKMDLQGRVQMLSNPNRIVIDLEGARLTRSTQRDIEAAANVMQYRPNSVRIIYELPFAPVIPTEPLRPASKLEFDFNPPSTQIDEPQPPIVRTNDPGEAQTTPVSLEAPVELRLAAELEGPSATLLTLSAPTKALKGKPTIFKPQPDVLEILLPGIVGQIPDTNEFSSLAVRAVSSTIEGKATRVRLELTSAMGAEIWTDGRGVAIQLLRPLNANGKVAGKIIVIDAGHGGVAAGTTYRGITEKSLTLAMAKYTATELASLGATVLMTRKDDANPSFNARTELGNRNNADLMISIHINAPGSGQGNPSGSQVYFHRKNPLSKLLGECIMKYMVRNGKMKNSGVRSDLSLYPKSGLVMLRQSKMTAVLVEVGFITNAGDRGKMTQSGFQKTVARSIADGVRQFFGEKNP